MSKVKKLKQNRFLWNNLIFFIGSLSVSFVNYLYYPVLGRLMLLEDFGELQTLLSLFLQASVLLAVLNIVTVSVASNYVDRETRGRVIGELQKLAFYLFLILFALTIVFSRQIQSFLNFKTFYPFFALAILLLISLPVTFRTAYLQAQHDFVGVSVGGLIAAICKLAFSSAFVYVGWRSFGAIGGIIAAQGVALAFLAKRTGEKGFNSSNTSGARLPDLAVIGSELRFAALVLLVSLVSTLFYTSDVVVVKHYFSPSQVGIYSGIAVVARIIFFATASISGVLLPTVKFAQSDGENRRVLFKSLIMLLFLGGFPLAFFFAAPRLVISLLIGDKYLPLVNLLPSLSFAIFLISVINLLFFYFLALRRFFVGVVAFFGGGFAAGLFYFNHKDFLSVVNDLIYGSIFMLMLLLGTVLFNWSKQRIKPVKNE